MKTILTLSLLFCVITLPSLAELSVQDLEKIDAKIKEAEARIKEYTDASETRITEYVSAAETRITEYVSAAETRITENTRTQIESIRTPITWLIGLFVALIALIGIPLVVLTVIVGWRSTRDNAQEKINQELREEIEILKQRRVVSL